MAFASTDEIKKQLLLSDVSEGEAGGEDEREIRGVSCSDERSAGDETLEDQDAYPGGSSESSVHDEGQSENGASVGFFEGVFG